MDLEIIRHRMNSLIGRGVIVETECGGLAGFGELSKGYLFLGNRLPLGKVRNVIEQEGYDIITMSKDYNLGRRK